MLILSFSLFYEIYWIDNVDDNDDDDDDSRMSLEFCSLVIIKLVEWV